MSTKAPTPGELGSGDTGLPAMDVRALALDPEAPGALYAGTTGGVYKSVNGGGLWTAANAGLANTQVRAFGACSRVAGDALCGHLRRRVFRSADGGANWEAASVGWRRLRFSPWRLPHRRRARSTPGPRAGAFSAAATAGGVGLS